MWKQFSEELAGVTAQTARRLAHVGGDGVPGRTGLLWGKGFLVTLALQAQDGESVPVVLPGGTETTARVHAWDSRTGLAVLKVEGTAATEWPLAAQPAVGSLALTVAFPSPQGPEARLDLVRFSGGASDWGRGVALSGLVQGDGSPWPGFSGAAVVDSSGGLVGLVAENRSGNGGFVVLAADLVRLIEPLIRDGSPKRAWLGVSTKPAGGQGLVLVGVDHDSPASRAGWMTGDLLVSLAGEALKDPGDLVRVLAGLKVETEVSARIVRNGEVLDKPVTPGGR